MRFVVSLTEITNEHIGRKVRHRDGQVCTLLAVNGLWGWVSHPSYVGGLIAALTYLTLVPETVTVELEASLARYFANTKWATTELAEMRAACRKALDKREGK